MRTWHWRSRPCRQGGRGRSETPGVRGAGPDGRRAAAGGQPVLQARIEGVTNLEALRRGMVGEGPRAGWQETIGARSAQVEPGRVVVELDDTRATATPAAWSRA